MKGNRLERLRRAYKDAMELLAEEVGKEFPIGTEVAVYRGRGVIQAVVYCLPCLWSDPERLGCECTAARTRHRFTADYHDCQRRGRHAKG